MFEITARTTAPYSSVCYIRCDWADGSRTVASGVVVGVNDVLTAMHVIYDASRGGWAQKIEVYPGADTRPTLDAPYGVFSNWGTLSGRASNWDLDGDGYLTAAESQGDLALIGLRTRIGDVTGILPTTSVRYDGDSTLAGYPARGTGLMVQQAQAHASSSAGVYEINYSLGPGASGGPLLVTNAAGAVQVLGVASAGNSALTESSYAALFGPGTAQWLAEAIAANDTLVAAASDGGNLFRGGVGRDEFSGSAGIDTVAYAGPRVSYALAKTATGWTVAHQADGDSGADTLLSVERLRFADMSLAVDLGGNAGKAAQLLGAVLGTAGVQNRGLAGVFLSYFDAGHTLAEGAATLVALGFVANVAGGADDAAFVRQVLRSVTGTEAGTETIQNLVGVLQGGMTQAQMLAIAADLPANRAHIDLVGLSQTGLAYT